MFDAFKAFNAVVAYLLDAVQYPFVVNRWKTLSSLEVTMHTDNLP